MEDMQINRGGTCHLHRASEILPEGHGGSFNRWEVPDSSLESN